MINIHPSLLPSFPGLHTHRRALEEGVRVHGCTVHFVTPTLDHGPIIVQAVVPVLDGDDEVSLAQRVLTQEHQIYPMAVRWFAEGRLRLLDERVELRAVQDGAGALKDSCHSHCSLQSPRHLEFTRSLCSGWISTSRSSPDCRR